MGLAEYRSGKAKKSELKGTNLDHLHHGKHSTPEQASTCNAAAVQCARWDLNAETSPLCWALLPLDEVFFCVGAMVNGAGVAQAP